LKPKILPILKKSVCINTITSNVKTPVSGKNGQDYDTWMGALAGSPSGNMGMTM
jgi:hypothetical protein